jgi:uncharacterized protein (DUF1778 family)
MADMEKDTRLTFRMPAATREALERAADEERRSVSDLAVLVIEDWLAARSASGAAKPSKKRGKGKK